MCCSLEGHEIEFRIAKKKPVLFPLKLRQKGTGFVYCFSDGQGIQAPEGENSCCRCFHLWQSLFFPFARPAGFRTQSIFAFPAVAEV